MKVSILFEVADNEKAAPERDDQSRRSGERLGHSVTNGEPIERVCVDHSFRSLFRLTASPKRNVCSLARQFLTGSAFSYHARGRIKLASAMN
jgi:hypothetical protein